MKKRLVFGVIVATGLLIGAIGNQGDTDSAQSSKANNVQMSGAPSSPEATPKKSIPTCDGTKVKSSCTLEGIKYKTYIYHPAVAEKSHSETTTTYREEITSYCTLCNDGTYSPSCATGRGACSHHGGVAQWNAPVKRSIPVDSTKTVIDAPAREAYVEKLVEEPAR